MKMSKKHDFKRNCSFKMNGAIKKIVKYKGNPLNPNNDFLIGGVKVERTIKIKENPMHINLNGSQQKLPYKFLSVS